MTLGCHWDLWSWFHQSPDQSPQHHHIASSGVFLPKHRNSFRDILLIKTNAFKVVPFHQGMLLRCSHLWQLTIRARTQAQLVVRWRAVLVIAQLTRIIPCRFMLCLWTWGLWSLQVLTTSTQLQGRHGLTPSPWKWSSVTFFQHGLYPTSVVIFQIGESHTKFQNCSVLFTSGLLLTPALN